MNCQETRRRLDDYLEGDLGSDESRALERHTDGCDACRRELAETRRLLDEALGLRVGLQPGRELWGDIEARLEPRRAPLAGAASRWLAGLVPPGGGLRWAAAGATLAGILVATLTLVGPSSVRRSVPNPVLRPGATTALSVATAGQRQAAAAEAPIFQVRRDLAATLEGADATLDPVTVREVERNLAILDEATGEIRAALEDQPSSIHLNRLLASQYQMEAEVLRRLHRL